MSAIRKLKEVASDFSILYVEDEGELRESVHLYLEKFFSEVSVAKDGQEGLDLYRQKKFDVIVTDIQMPRLSGIEMAKKIKEIEPHQEILVVSAYTDFEYFLDSIKIGISGYVIKPIDYVQMNKELYKIAFKLMKFRENEMYKDHLEQLVEQRTKERETLQVEKIDNYQKTLLALVKMVEERDSYTGGHSQRVAKYSVMIAKEMGYDEKECEKLYQAGILHDIGKISTPDSILLKPGKLNNIEYNLIKEHVTIGYEMLKKIPMYNDLAEIIRYHHERFDGNGYPDGLKGDQIPPLSRVMMVADAFDAMTTNRIYKKRKKPKEACEEIKRFSSLQFNPEVAEAACRVLKKEKVSEAISQVPENKIEQERFAYFYKDQVADAYNKDYLELMLFQNNYERTYKCLNAFFLHNFTKYNEKKGWSEGDNILAAFADYLRGIFPEALIFRVYGDDFIMLNKDHVEINDDFLKSINLFKNTKIKVTNKHIDLYDKDISSLNGLERDIRFY